MMGWFSKKQEKRTTTLVKGIIPKARDIKGLANEIISHASTAKAFTKKNTM
jgi:hypothetical protein